MDEFDENEPMMNRSILVLLDISKAYDTVWREKLLRSMLEKGIPAQFIRWLRSFLNDRTARVSLNGHLSRSVLFKQGLPQGSVLAPLLFLFYINNLAESLAEDVLMAIFVDDVTILSTARLLREAERNAQTSFDAVCKWSVECKLQLKAGKSEAAVFSSDTKNAKFRPCTRAGNFTIPFNPTPWLVGVILDRQLTFSPHVQTITKRLDSNFRKLSPI